MYPRVVISDHVLVIMKITIGFQHNNGKINMITSTINLVAFKWMKMLQYQSNTQLMYSISLGMWYCPVQHKILKSKCNILNRTYSRAPRWHQKYVNYIWNYFHAILYDWSNQIRSLIKMLKIMSWGLFLFRTKNISTIYEIIIMRFSMMEIIKFAL